MHGIPVGGILDLHMRGKLVGKTAHFATTHRIRLAGKGERPHPRVTDPAGQEMAVDNGIDLVDTAGRLVDALGVNRNNVLGFGKEGVEGTDILDIQRAFL